MPKARCIHLTSASITQVAQDLDEEFEVLSRQVIFVDYNYPDQKMFLLDIVDDYWEVLPEYRLRDKLVMRDNEFMRMDWKNWRDAWIKDE